MYLGVNLGRVWLPTFIGSKRATGVPSIKCKAAMLPGPGAFLLDRSFIVDEWTTHLELGAILWENSEIVQHLLGIVEHF